VDDCIFCKIIQGSIPSVRVYEDKDVVAFLDINPVNPGHLLVVPRRHTECLADTEDGSLHAVMSVIKKCSAAVQKATGMPGFNVVQNNGSCAGQIVPHLHFHIIPRAPSDGFRFGWRKGAYAEGEAKALQERIKQAL
jgi:histidine triad (HIT) family protein